MTWNPFNPEEHEEHTPAGVDAEHTQAGDETPPKPKSFGPIINEDGEIIVDLDNDPADQIIEFVAATYRQISALKRQEQIAKEAVWRRFVTGRPANTLKGEGKVSLVFYPGERISYDGAVIRAGFKALEESGVLAAGVADEVSPLRPVDGNKTMIARLIAHGNKEVLAVINAAKNEKTGTPQCSVRGA